MGSRIPLDLNLEVTDSSGARHRWDANQAPGSRPQNFRFGTKIGEGYGDGGLQLSRRIDQDYADLGLVNDVTATGTDGSTAYEGRVSGLPRDLNDRHVINVQIAGYMAHAKDKKFAEVYCDRDPGQWQPPDLVRRAAIAGTNPLASINASASGGGLAWDADPVALPDESLSELWYTMPPGLNAAKLGYRGARSGTFTGFETPTVFSSGGGSAALTLDDALRSATLSAVGQQLLLRMYLSSGPFTPATALQQRLTKVAVYGDHGLTLRTGDTSEPDGVFASDVIRDIVGRWCPYLDPSGVQDTDYVIQHLAFRDLTNPYDAFLELNKYHLWHLAVWENRVLHYRPYDLTDYDWEIRTDDPGTTFSPQGPSTEDLVNGMFVHYTDPLTGTATWLSPETYAELRADAVPTNPWNQHGVHHWGEIALSSPSLTASALNLGAAAISDRNRPKTPGTITVRGYIRDRAGNQQPCWKVRAGDAISITNFPNDTPRLIVETDYDDETKTARLSIDQPFALLDAYLDRQANALQAAGLA